MFYFYGPGRGEEKKQKTDSRKERRTESEKNLPHSSRGSKIKIIRFKSKNLMLIKINKKNYERS
jgi:hypothetical protein